MGEKQADIHKIGAGREKNHVLPQFEYAVSFR